MNLTIDQMKNLGATKNYYAQAGDKVSETKENPFTFATIKATGGSEKNSYDCTASINVSLDGDMKSVLEDKDAYIELTTSEGITLTNNKFTSGTPVSLHTLKETALTDTLNFTLTGTDSSKTVTGYIYLVNDKDRPQDDLAGKQLKVSVVVNNLSCTATLGE